MTLQQLKYVTTVAQTGTISDAAKKLFISQPSLTKAVRELEKEMEITIFERTNRGIVISKEGETFLGYARQVLEQAAILEDKYKGQDGGRTQFFLLFRGDFFTFGEKEKYPCERQGNAV
jgi:DNA-binding transcriptional LysR family regulator